MNAFITGWNYGNAQKRELSPREIAVQFPEISDVGDMDAFAQGMLDGIVGDRFRLGLVLARTPGLTQLPRRKKTKKAR